MQYDNHQLLWPSHVEAHSAHHHQLLTVALRHNLARESSV